MEMQVNKWWKNAVVYQVYPRSFQDSDGDGIGDIPGLIRRLDYLKELGINAIWLSPVYQSPQDDNGYDISDYQGIDPMFGTLENMENLIEEADARGIKIVMDLVLNHTSDEHRWFQEAKKSRENPYHDYYVWVDGTAGTQPNDLKAAFGGSAWEWVAEVEQYYLHQFSVKQPDLNWHNPVVRQELYDMINWWTEKGIGGYRLDVIDQIAKEPLKGITNNGPRLHEYIQEMSRNCFQGRNLLTVGETWGATTQIGRQYSNPDESEFSMVFQFEHSLLDQQPGKEKWDLAPLKLQDLKQVFEKWQTELYETGWNSLFWDNHDLPRAVSRYGNDKEYREPSAKMLATLLHGLQGTPYIYQGEELGMTNVRFSMEDYRDIETLNMYKERILSHPEDDVLTSIYTKGRDNARTPMQWDNGKHAGFSDSSPWIKLNPNYVSINAKQQMSEPESVFRYYQKLIALRKQHEIITEGRFHMLAKQSEELFCYERQFRGQRLLVLCNFCKEPAELPKEIRIPQNAEVLISNYNDEKPGQQLRPYEAVMMLITD